MADSTEDDNSEQIVVSHSKPGKKPVSHKKNTGKKDQQRKKSTKKNADNGNKATKKSKKTQMSCPLSPNFNVSLTELLASPTPMPNNSGAVVDDPMNAGNSTSNSEPTADVQGRDNDTSTVTNEVLSQMTLQSDTIKSLEAQIEILQSELSANKKTDSYQKSQIKKLTKENDNLKREISKHNGIRKFTTEPPRVSNDNTTTTSHQCSSEDELLMAKARIKSLESYIRDTANSLLNAINDDQSSMSTATVNVDDENSDFEAIVPRNRFRSKATQTAAVPVAPSGSGPSAKSIPATSSSSSAVQCSTGRSTPSQIAAGASHAASASRSPGTDTTGHSRVLTSAAGSNPSTRYRDSLVNNKQKKHAVVIGTSLVRGVSSCLHKRDIDSTTYTYPGAEIPTIRSRINSVLPLGDRPRQVVLQVGGNDLENHRPDQVIKQYDGLIHQVKSRCSNSTTILVGKIPPRRQPGVVRDGINKVNTYLRNRGMKGDNVKFVDCCPSFPHQFKRDRVHFDKNGTSCYADKLACQIINFQLPGRNRMAWYIEQRGMMTL